MPEKPGSALPRTPLRASYERVRSLDAEVQLRECIDLLGNPDILINDVAEAFVLTDSCCEPPDEPGGAELPGEDDGDELVLERFAPGVRLQVSGDEPGEMRCLAGSFDPLRGPLPEGAPHGLDYVAAQLRPEPGLVLGAVASGSDSTPYTVLLRLLCCFTELAAPALLAHWDRHLFKGMAGGDPRFGLQMALWRPGERTMRGAGPAHFALYELTRDLAELAKEACREAPPLGSYLTGITCLRLEPDDTEGTLGFEWRV